MNLPLASRHGAFFATAFVGHAMNLPLVSRHDARFTPGALTAFAAGAAFATLVRAAGALDGIGACAALVGAACGVVEGAAETARLKARRQALDRALEPERLFDDRSD